MRALIRTLQRRMMRTEARLLFAFPGGAGAWPGMGRTMFRQHEPFRRTVRAAGAVVEEILNWSPVPWFEGVDDPATDPELKRRNEIIHLGVLHIAQGELWRSEGVQPHGVLGVSLGEITGPHIAGAISLTDTMRVVTAVARVVSTSREDGQMFVIRATRDEALQMVRGARMPMRYLGSMAPRTAIMLGKTSDADAIRASAGHLIEREIPTTWQYHTPSLGHHRSWMREELEGLRSVAPSCPVYSSVVGGKVPRDARFDHQFFAWMFTHPFLYSDALSAALQDGLTTIVNLGPRPMNNTVIAATAQSLGCRIELIDTMLPSGEAKSWRSANLAVRRHRIAPRDPAPATEPAAAVWQSTLTHYEELRRSGPAHYLAAHRRWLLIGYNEVLQALTDAETFSSDMEELHRTDAVLLGSDPPAHDLPRRLLSRLFAGDEVERRAGLARAAARSLLQPLAAGAMLDVVHEFAQPLLFAVAAELFGLDPSRTASLSSLASEAHGDLVAMSRLMEGPATDVFRESPLFHPFVRDLGDEAAARSILRLLWTASMTPQHAIGNGTLFLLEQPEIRRAVQHDRTLLPNFVDEVLRLRPPADRVPRMVTRDVTVGAVTIRKGEIVELGLAAANRDPERFDDPATFRLDRTPNAHLSFGGGVHRCVGAALGKSVMVAAFDALLDIDFHAVQPLYAVRAARGATLRQIEALVIAS